MTETCTLCRKTQSADSLLGVHERQVGEHHFHRICIFKMLYHSDNATKTCLICGVDTDFEKLIEEHTKYINDTFKLDSNSDILDFLNFILSRSGLITDSAISLAC